MTSPSLFEKYFAPYSRELSGLLHKKGKLLGTHLDGEPKPLLGLIPGSGLDVVEAFTPAPMFHCTVGDARKAFGGKVVILGGIPSVLLVPDAISDEQFETQMAELFKEIAPCDNSIPGMGNNTMPGASLERVKRVAEMVESYGSVPIPAVQ